LLSEKVIPPNGEGEVKVTYSSGKLKGEQSKSITVHSDDPEHPRISLTVKGSVKEAVVCRPERLIFGKVVLGESLTRQLTVTPGEGEKAEVKSVEINSEYLTADFSESKEKDGYIVTVTLSPDAPRGPIYAELRINTDNEHAKQVTVSVMATVTGEIVTTPDQVFLVMQIGEQDTGSVFLIEKVRGGAFKISKVDTDLDYITTEVQPVEEGRRYRVRVNATAGAPVGRASGTMTVHTDDVNDPKIDVPLSVVVRGNLNVVPEQLSFGLVTQGQSPVRTIRLMSRKEGLKVKKVETSADALTARVETTEPGKNFQIIVSVDQNAPEGPLLGKVIIHTNDELQPIVEVSITGRIAAAPGT